MDKFYIAPYDQNSGLETDVKPFMIPDNAFSTLLNAYQWRGRVRKRPGEQYLDGTTDSKASRLRINIGTTGGTGELAFTTLPGAVLNVGSMFSVGDVEFTVITVPTVVGNASTLSTDVLSVGTVRLNSTGPNVYQFRIVGVNAPIASTAVYWYPALPVMGLLTYESANINNETTIAFDTQFAYLYSSGWERSSGGSSTWVGGAGSDTRFLWGTTWVGANANERVFFVTNFYKDETLGMRSFDGGTWTTFKPLVDASNFLITARILIVFKNSLVALNTYEGTTPGGAVNYANRARWSNSVTSPLPSANPDAWRTDIDGEGGGIDAATTEAIMSAELIKDRLIVYFERSTWELVYTGNNAYPFIWQKINTELGAESTFSIVPFDKVALGVGNVGIHACNGINVERIDTKIPNTVFEIHNLNAGVDRVYGIRDYFTEMVYWAFPSDDATSDQPFPARLLAYNYASNTWAFFEDSITVFGYFQPQTGITWAATDVTWEDDVAWDDGQDQAAFRQVISGNQQGYTFLMKADIPENVPALQITAMSFNVSGEVVITSIDHNLRAGDYVFIEGIVSNDGLEVLNNLTYIVTPIDEDSFILNTTLVTSGTYLGGGELQRVSNINIATKQFNFYAQQGRNFFIPQVDFLVDKTNQGEIQIAAVTSTSLQANDELVGNGVLEMFPYPTYYPYEELSTQLWRRVYFNADGSFIQLTFFYSQDQMLDSLTFPAFEDFQLHTMIFSANPSSARPQ